jgi:hypothetical protein
MQEIQHYASNTFCDLLFPKEKKDFPLFPLLWLPPAGEGVHTESKTNAMQGTQRVTHANTLPNKTTDA